MKKYKGPKGTAWKWFSKYIRLRDCLATTGDPEWGMCISCGRTYEFFRLQAGHLVPGRRNAVLFDEDGVNAQCVRCNKYMSGNTAKYRVVLLKKIGPHRVELCEARAYETVKYTDFDYKQIAKMYREKYKEIGGE